MATVFDSPVLRQRLNCLRLQEMEDDDVQTFGRCDCKSYSYFALSMLLFSVGTVVTVMALGDAADGFIIYHLGHMWLVGPIFICSGLMVAVKSMLYLRRKSIIQMLLHQRAIFRTNEGLSIIPPINVPEGEKLVIQTVLSHLFYMMHEATKTSDQNQNMAKAVTGDEEEYQNIADNEKNSQKEAPSTNTLLTETKTPLKIVIPSDDYFTARIIKTEILEKSPEVVMSPSRYRSLDTLTAKKILSDEIPEPGQLKKKEDATEKKSVLHVAYSSPNLSIPLKPSNTSSPVANITILKTGYSKLLFVQELVKDVIDILEKAQEIPKVSFDVSNIKASTESLCAKKTTVSTSSSDPNLIVKRNIKPLCRPPIRPTTSNKSIVATTSKNILLKPNTRRKSSENVSPNLKMNIKPATVSSSSKSQKFAHVKSTIPKTNVCKKL